MTLSGNWDDRGAGRGDLELLRTALDRRRFLTLGAAAMATALASGLPDPSRALAQGRAPREYPFTLGVASGDPLPDSVVLWTRLAPNPLDPFGGIEDRQRRIVVQWEVAEDERFRRVVRRGAASAYPEYAHSVHVDVRGLRPGREYHYRFRTGRDWSPAGRTRTAPAFGAPLASLAIGVASCNSWPDGFWTAYRHLSEEDVDVILHTGDYVYEYGVGPTGGARQTPVPAEFATETDSLDRYRTQYGLYKSDPDLQAAHAAAPWIMTWDDHEVENNYAGLISERGVDPTFVIRRANAYRAYYEHVPIRATLQPTGPDLPLYRRFRFGDLVELNVLDTRQYRTDQPANLAGAQDPAATMTGPEQERWLLDGMAASTARWNLVVQQTMMAQNDRTAGPGQSFNFDMWDGYRAQRSRLVDFFGSGATRNPVVITGDFHRNFDALLKRDFDDPASAATAVEFVGTSISSAGDGQDLDAFGALVLRENPHVVYANHQRGYLRCTATPDGYRTDHRVVPYVTRPGAPIATDASFLVPDGRPALEAI